MTNPAGPVYEGSIEEFVVTEEGRSYRILYLPDKNNADLQKEGKPAHYYWMPSGVRIARNESDDYKFHLLHFVGIRGETTTVGASGDEEISGGLLSLTTTAAPPENVLQKSHGQLREKFKGNDDRYWGWRSPAAPVFGAIPIADSQTSISNVSPDSDGAVPAAGVAGGGREARGNGTRSAVTGTEGRSGRPGGDSESSTRPGSGTAARPGGAEPVADAGPEPPFRTVLETMPMGVDASREDFDGQRSSLDMWYARMDGQGPGSIDPGGENAFSALLGSIPTAILWQGFRGRYSPVSVTRAMKLKVWSENIHLKITGDWKKVHTHFSGHATGGYKWFSADLKGELNRLIISGEGLNVELSIDGTTPSGKDYEEAINKRIDLILEKFLKMAQDVIFEPPEPIPAAEAPKKKGIFAAFQPWSAGLSLKAAHNVTEVEIKYEESINERYLLDHVVSSTLEGFYDEIKKDPDAEKKYFTTLYLDEWDRKVHRTVTPVLNAGNPAREWAGDPVAFLSAQVGYVDVHGEPMWQGHVFDPSDRTPWKPEFIRKNRSDVADPPGDWSPDTTYVKRRVHFKEPPGQSDFPFSNIDIEKNVVDLDPGARGTALEDINLEVRADSVGVLDVGPIFLGVELENSRQFVEVTFKAHGTTHDGRDRSPVRFTWDHEHQNESRHWKIFTGQPEFVTEYEYQVRVVIRGSLFTKGMEWTGPWETVHGNGPIMITVPTPEEAVDSRSLSAREAAAVESVAPTLEQETDAERPTVTSSTGRPSREDATPPAGRPPLSTVAGGGGREDVSEEDKRVRGWDTGEGG